MRKKGLKWSNISVKKYHHNPVLGVKSGKFKFAPQVCGIHWKPPHTTDAAPMSKPKYTKNSMSNDADRRKVILDSVQWGDASCEMGPVGCVSSRIVGATTRMEGIDRLTRSARDNKEGEARPLHANIMLSKARVFSNEEEDRATDGKKMYGLSRYAAATRASLEVDCPFVLDTLDLHISTSAHAPSVSESDHIMEDITRELGIRVDNSDRYSGEW
jgi:hypothetical protein